MRSWLQRLARLARATVTGALTLTTAACSTPSVSPALKELAGPLAQPPAEMLKACADPVALAGALNRGQVRGLWAEDRAALVSCGEGKQAVVEFYRARDDALAGR